MGIWLANALLIVLVLERAHERLYENSPEAKPPGERAAPASVNTRSPEEKEKRPLKDIDSYPSVKPKRQS